MDTTTTYKEDTIEGPSPKRVKRSRPTLQSGHECIFVKELPEHLHIECAICLCILTKPQLVDCSCGSHFCQSCLRPIKAERKPCPLCKGRFSTAVVDYGLQRIINGLDVYCSFKESGCQWVGELSKLPEHLNVEPSDGSPQESGCPYVHLECRHCKEKFRREIVFEHEKGECLKRPACCEICGEYKSTFEDVTNIHMALCPSQLVPCPKACGRSIPLKSVDKHLKDDCPLEMTQCVFSYAGCDAKLLRKDMSDHIGKSLAHHLSLQAVNHKQLLDKQASMQKEIDELKERLDNKTDALRCDVEGNTDEISDLRSKQESLHTHINVLPVHLVVNDFAARRKTNEVWQSEPFYSHPRGYKMCLKVYTNGRNEAVNTHLSVYIRVLQGDFDYQLMWPFRGTVYINVMDANGEDEPHNDEIKFDGEAIPGSEPQVKKGDKNTEWGIDKFLCKELLSSFYNFDSDSVCFEVTRVKNDHSCCVM